MGIVWSDAGLLKKLANEQSYFDTLRLHLFSNNHTPAAGDTVSAYTECAFSGYSYVTMTTWGTPATVTSGLARMEEVQHDFTWDGTGSPGDIYGYYVTDPSSGDLLWAERYGSAPFSPTLSQPTFSVLPRMDAQSIP